MYVPLISIVGKRGRDVSGHVHSRKGCYSNKDAFIKGE